MLSFANYIISLSEGIHDPARHKAIFLAGGPGSGKSYVSARTTHGLGFKHINTDDLFERGLKKHGLDSTPENIYSKRGQEIRQHAKDLTNKREHSYVRGRLGLVIDGTGKDPEKIKRHSERLRKLGYDTHMILVNTSLQTAKARNRNRERVLPDHEVEQMHKQVQNNIGHFQQHFGREHMHIVDNNHADEHALLQVHKHVRKIAAAPLRNPIGIANNRRNNVTEAILATGVGQQHKFADSEVGMNASTRRGFDHVGNVKGHDVYHRTRQNNNHDFVMTKEGEKKIHTHLNSYVKTGGFHHVNFVQSKPGEGPGVHNLYHHLVTKHNIMITSKKQSAGGAGVWAKLQKMRGVHVHAVDSKGKGHHIDIGDTVNTHVNPDDLYMPRAKDDLQTLKHIQSLRLVAHKSN